MKNASKLGIFAVLIMVFAMSIINVSAGGFARKSCVIASSTIGGYGVLKINVNASLDTSGSSITRAYDTSVTITGIPLAIQMSNTGSKAVISGNRKSATLYGWANVWVGIKTQWFNITLYSRSINGSCVVNL